MIEPDAREQKPATLWRTGRLIRIAIANAQSAIATALGVSRARRIETVVLMLDNNARRAPGYWLQLFLATGIATLGLVLSSTAVVIGGMLVSPLMGPIVELGMGFAVGSSLLVIRAFLRVVLSVAGVVIAAALLTLSLPFHEVTAEVVARTSPTLLDLLVAVFCALAAAYTTVRQTSDTTAAAAGTAIGISLVPPLCVTGFGIGTGSATIAGGAGLLFTANFSAILVLAVSSFLLLGYNQVDASALEDSYLGPNSLRVDRLALRMHGTLRSIFGSRYGLFMRLTLPLVFLAAVAVPLSRALDEVAWEIRVRDAVRDILASERVRTVQSAVAIERHTVSLRLVVVASPDQATALERRLETRISAAAGVAPSLVVTAVPDVSALQKALARVTREPAVTPPAVNLGEATQQLSTALAAAWPDSAAGKILGWTLEVTPKDFPRLVVRHLGSPLGAAGEAMLARSVSSAMQTAFRIVDVPFQVAPLVLDKTTSDSTWLRAATLVLNEIVHTDSGVVCIQRPRAQGNRRTADAIIEATIGSSMAARSGRIELKRGAHWTINVGVGACS